MINLTEEQTAQRERTLLIAFLLSLPGPLFTGYALISSHSTTQLADFIRRGVELIALFLSWWVFHQIHRKQEMKKNEKDRLELTAGFTVSGAMILSGLVMVSVAITRYSAFTPGGNVVLGLTIAILGLITNGWFWRRYTILNREKFNPVIGSQQGLYRAKASVDLCVVIALTAVAIAPYHPATRYVDILGSIMVAGYLVWTGVKLMRSNSISFQGFNHPKRDTVG